jgi:hypothetical protein
MLKDIKEYEGRYAISDEGQVWSYYSKRWLKQWDIVSHRKGYTREQVYKQVNFKLNGKLKKYSVHRLVALAFIPNPDNKPEVNHIDGNPSNNHISNLEWVTASENLLHAYRIGLIVISDEHRKRASELGKRTGKITAKINNKLKRKLTFEQAQEIKLLYNNGKSGISQRQLAKKYKVDQKVIVSIVKERSYKEK